MSPVCLACLGPLTTGSSDHGPHHPPYHSRCVRRLFGSRHVPVIDIELAKLHTLAGAMVQHTSISGAQRKISLGFTRDRATLRVPDIGGEYILKPQTGVYPSLPENEHLTMQLGARFGLEVPPCGLVRLDDDSLAYIVARFDRLNGGGKLRQEDFCQLATKSAKEKYAGSAELCARTIRRFSDEPIIDLLKLFRQLVFSWWVGNGDLHLKNLSLIAGPDGRHRLSPVYDLVATRLVMEDDRMALQMGGRDRHFTRASWAGFARYCGIPDRAADRVLTQPARLTAQADQLIERSLLPDEVRRAYSSLLHERGQSFAA